MFVDRDAPPLAATGVTMLGVVYLGVLGGFAGLLLGFPANTDHILAVAIATVTYDVVGLLAGSSLGRTRMAPSISPNKTWEGTIVGIVAAVIMSVIVTGSIVDPWSQKLAHPLQLGLVCAIAAALGDLASSMLKRDLKVKDWGNLLPGHGGAMDRFSGFLFALPAAYYLCRLLNVY
jgi:phosphatidate cytidylyltransferase